MQDAIPGLPMIVSGQFGADGINVLPLAAKVFSTEIAQSPRWPHVMEDLAEASPEITETATQIPATSHPVIAHS
jgi:hypothetical protein